jgi:5,10-methylenetetrahydrofolate reductase
MTTVVEVFGAKTPVPVFLCDFSPPRGADLAELESVRQLQADFTCVAYNPGRSVRVDSLAVAAYLEHSFNKQAIFNLSPRDANKLALQTHLLGAEVLGVSNVLVIKGDNFSKKDLSRVKTVSDFKATELVTSIIEMNSGTDFRGLKLRQPTSFCVGAAVDLTQPSKSEAELTYRKVEAGAHFLVTQLVFQYQQIEMLLDAYHKLAGQALDLPVFYGLPVLEKDSLIYGDMPEQVRRDLDAGRAGSDIALEQFHSFSEQGIRGFYVIPPILRGGARNYRLAAEFLKAANQ